MRPVDQSFLSLMPAWTSRLVVTLAALVAYRFAHFIPLPGVDATQVAQGGFGAIDRLSIVALGIVPWLSSAILLEFAALVLPARARLSFVSGGHVNPFSMWCVGLAVAFAVVQGAGIASALEQVRGLVPVPGPGFRIGVMVTLVGGAAVVILLGRLITRDGFGAGFWILLAFQALLNLTTDVRQLITALDQGVFDLPLVTMLLAGMLAGFSGAVVVFLSIRRPDEEAIPLMAWPAYIGGAVVTWVALAWQFLASGLFGRGVHTDAMLPGRLPGAVLTVLIIWLIVRRYTARHAIAPLSLPLTALVGALVVAHAATPSLIGFHLPGGASIIVIAAVVAMIWRQVGPHEPESDGTADEQAG